MREERHPKPGMKAGSEVDKMTKEKEKWKEERMNTDTNGGGAQRHTGGWISFSAGRQPMQSRPPVREQHLGEKRELFSSILASGSWVSV